MLLKQSSVHFSPLYNYLLLGKKNINKEITATRYILQLNINQKRRKKIEIKKTKFQNEQEVKEGIVIVANKTLYYNLDGQSSTLSMWYGLTLLDCHAHNVEHI